MARSDAVWGIDVGQCALKALRCRPHEDSRRIVADAFDYIEYPKILSQAGADPGELVADALKQFLSRNSVRGDRVAISVSGQSGLARFIKLPPVESKKIPDIVRYEARQQIPFDLNDVIWDYQRMGGGSEEEGFALETEIGLFAMKRDAVFRTLEPFKKANIEVDVVQLTPLALYNFALFDQLTDLPPLEEYDPENPPESIVILSLGTDATDLVVTNGLRVWQRSIPLGGNHFTKALTKELKLTFAKAEHLKRNAAAAQDPKAVFQAMRPIFGDLLTEVQRSIGYFTSLNRAAKIGRIVSLGSTMKLPGLRRYLSQSLGYEVERLDAFRGLEGAEVLAAPAFKDNVLAFPVCYGLALQGLEKSGIYTNLLPREIVKDRIVRQKKPWAVAAVAVLLLGCGISYAISANGLRRVTASDWSTALTAASSATGKSQQLQTAYGTASQQFNSIREIGQHLVGNVENRLLWMELLRAVGECLPPRYPDNQPPNAADKTIDADKIMEWGDLHITHVDCQQVEDLATWYQAVKPFYQPLKEDQPASPAPTAAPAAPVTPSAAEGAGASAAPADGAAPAPEAAAGEDPGPTGKGWVVKLNGYHFHNIEKAGAVRGAHYVRETLIKNLQSRKVSLPGEDGKTLEPVSIEDVGIRYPVLLTDEAPKPYQLALGGPGTTANVAPGANESSDKQAVNVLKFDFHVQFCWSPVAPSERWEKQREAKKQEQEQAKQGPTPATE